MDLPLWGSVLVAGGLVCFSGLFSGLTLGLLSLDSVALQILADVGVPPENTHAAAIAPLRRRGNLLLCTLLVGNVIVNSFLSIFLADLTSGLLGLVVSSTLIVILGEIVPQATCSRHGLAIGYYTVWLTRAFMILFLPVTWPLAYCLDKALGREVGLIYRREELKRLIEIHVEHPEHAEQDVGITKDDHQLIRGALEYSAKTVNDVMTPLERVYMVEMKTKLDFDCMLDIYRSGYTRIPVYEGSRQHITGILYTKDLILVDPDDEVEVGTIVSFHGRSHVRFIEESIPLNQVFSSFKAQYIHVMIAFRGAPVDATEAGEEPVTNGSKAEAKGGSQIGPVKPPAQVVFDKLPGDAQHVTGIITLEDVLEEMIQAEIVDETDVYESNLGVPVKRGGRPDVSAYLALFQHKIRENIKLSSQETQAIAAYLAVSLPEFKPFEINLGMLKSLVRSGQMLDMEEGPDDELEGPESITDLLKTRLTTINEQSEGLVLLYKRGVRSDTFTLVLQGRVMVRAGSEEFLSELGPWSHLGSSALTQEAYIPDYTAIGIGPCRLLRLNRTDYVAALKAGQVGTVLASSKRAISLMTLEGSSLQRNSAAQPHSAVPTVQEGDERAAASTPVSRTEASTRGT